MVVVYYIIAYNAPWLVCYRKHFTYEAFVLWTGVKIYKKISHLNVMSGDKFNVNTRKTHSSIWVQTKTICTHKIYEKKSSCYYCCQIEWKCIVNIVRNWDWFYCVLLADSVMWYWWLWEAKSQNVFCWSIQFHSKKKKKVLIRTDKICMMTWVTI